MPTMEALYMKSSVFKKFLFKIVSKAPYTYLHTRRVSACLFIITKNYYNIYVKNRYRFNFSSSSTGSVVNPHQLYSIYNTWAMNETSLWGRGVIIKCYSWILHRIAYLHIYKLVCSSDSNNKVQQETAKGL